MSFVTLIPAAGAGTRMRPLTNTVPKAMIQVAGFPILYHIVKKAVDAGSNEIVIIVEYLSDSIIKRMPEYFPNLKFHFVKQGEMKGLGHAIYKAKDLCTAKPVLIIYGDTLFEADLSAIVKSDEPKIGVSEVEDPRRFGIIEVNDKHKITKFVEKPDNPSTNLALPGVNYFPDATSLFDAIAHIIDNDIKTKGEYQVTDAYDIMIQNGVEMGYFKLDAWYDCGKHAETLDTNQALLANQGTVIDKTATVSSATTINDPVYIGPGAKIDGGVIGPHADIGPNAEIKDSELSDIIIGEGTRIIASKINRSMLGSVCRIQGLHAANVVLGDTSLVGDEQD